MFFKSKIEMSEPCIKKFKRNDALGLFTMIVFIILEIGAFFHRHNETSGRLFVSLLCAFVLFMIIKLVYNGMLIINRLIDSVEIVDDIICLTTFSSSMLLFILKKDPVVIKAPLKLITYRISELPYGLDKNYTGLIYILNYAGIEYILSENFFDDFNKLKMTLCLPS